MLNELSTLVAGNDILASELNQNFQEVEEAFKRGQFQFTAGQDGSEGDALCVGTAGEYTGAESTATPDSSYPIAVGNFLAQTFLTSQNARKLVSVTFSCTSNTSDIVGARVTIRTTSGGVPTSTVITGSTVTQTFGSPYADRTFTFATPIDVDPDTTYAISIERDNTLDPITTTTAMSVEKKNSSGYADGSVYTSSDGSTWSSTSGDFAPFEVVEIYTDAGKVYLSNSTNDDELANNFIGFAASDFTEGGTVIVNINGIDESQTSLNIGSTYYLQDTPGEIGSSAGSQPRKIGRAIAEDKILIIHENQ